MILERLLQYLPEMRNVGGVRVIPYMQVRFLSSFDKYIYVQEGIFAKWFLSVSTTVYEMYMYLFLTGDTDADFGSRQ